MPGDERMPVPDYFNMFNVFIKVGRLLVQLLKKASGFKPPSRFFNSPPASPAQPLKKEVGFNGIFL